MASGACVPAPAAINSFDLSLASPQWLCSSVCKRTGLLQQCRSHSYLGVSMDKM